ncbi:AhpC/TSA family protein [Gillisia sp. M10.2A]|uniref:AhpC/TSA family protein n=1 Tax=Gillisia lutea TaxID=2909668 RepID=A0ABS9EIF0_9FLAO|nr:TlpA disulfide reductase family protein [Gillisia lutea]MCF4102634.1 AhpC/TSA family protein [Gillisia lutea]
MKQFIAAIFILSLIGCNKSSDGYSISGELKGIENGKMVYLSELDKNLQPTKIDSTVVKDEKFSLDLPEVTQSNLNFLAVEGVNGSIVFISENEPIEFEIYKDSLPTSDVKGGKENKTFYTYLHHLKDVNKKVMGVRTDMRKVMTTSRDSAEIASLQKTESELKDNDITFKKKIIKENPKAFTSVLVLTDMINMGTPANEIKTLFETLDEKLKQAPLAVSLKENLDKRTAVEIGSVAPNFTAPDTEGKPVALKDAMGKVTLIDFWAAWCKPCRMENPNVVATYNKYHDKGFNIIGVSLDKENQKDKWLQAIADDNLTWTQVSNLKFWQEPVAQLYGVQAIPAQFILDENGVIVAKNLRGDDLDAKIKELLEQ